MLHVEDIAFVSCVTLGDSQLHSIFKNHDQLGYHTGRLSPFDYIENERALKIWIIEALMLVGIGLLQSGAG